MFPPFLPFWSQNCSVVSLETWGFLRKLTTHCPLLHMLEDLGPWEGQPACLTCPMDKIPKLKLVHLISLCHVSHTLSHLLTHSLTHSCIFEVSVLWKSTHQEETRSEFSFPPSSFA